jgi:hypothetical protein
LFVGEIPDGKFVLHKCDNPACVNPGHLFIGTQADNVKDMWDKNRARQGINRGESHGMSKLTADDVRAIRESSASGPVLAARYDVTRTTIADIRNRKIWTHI